MKASDIPAGSRRFQQLTEAEMTPRQREVYQGIVSGPRKGALGPFNALLRYSTVSMILNVDRHPLPDGEKPPLKPL